VRISVDRSQVLAYRVKAHGLDRRGRRVDDLALLDLGVQDTPSGSAYLALSARLERAPEPSDSYALIWSLRGAPHYHRGTDLKRLAAQLYPVSDVDAFKRLFDVSPGLKKRGWTGLDAFATAVETMRSVVTKPMSKGEASAAVTSELPREFSVDCRVCKARHVREQTFRLSTLPAGLELEPGTSPPVLRPRKRRGTVTKRAAGAADLVDTYLRLNGPAGPDEVAWFFQTSTSIARAIMPDDLAEIDVDGRTAWLPEDRVRALRNAKAIRGVRLLPQSDGFTRVADRELMVPRKDDRDALYRTLGSPGGALVDGEIVGTWRAKTDRHRLAITVTPFRRMPKARRADLDGEAARVASARGFDDVAVVVARP